jgi:hypothetical protein
VVLNARLDNSDATTVYIVVFNARLKVVLFGEVAERLNAAVSKTVKVKAFEGSNPSLSVAPHPICVSPDGITIDSGQSIWLYRFNGSI